MRRAGSGANVRRQGLPPYVSYAAFRRFVESLKQGIPSRIDRTVLGWLSPAGQAQLVLALRFLGLTEDQGAPTEKLEDLAAAQGPLRQKLLRETVTSAYRHVLGGLNLQKATSGQLEDQFKKAGASGVTLRKCVAFFVTAMDDSGIGHSRYTAKRHAGRPIGARSARNEVAGSEREQTAGIKEPDRPVAELRREDPRIVALAERLPVFDPTWSDDVKTKWFEAFQSLLDLQRSERKP